MQATISDYTFSTKYGSLVVRWEDADNVTVFTQSEVNHRDYSAGGVVVVDTPDQPLVVHGVAYHVLAHLHRSGCVAFPPGFHSGSYCFAHHGSNQAMRADTLERGGWALGVVARGIEGSRQKAGEIDPNSAHIQVGRGAYYNGGASSAARKAIDPLVWLAVQCIANQAPGAATEARIAVLRRELAAAQSAAVRAHADAILADEAAEKARQALFEALKGQREAAAA